MNEFAEFMVHTVTVETHGGEGPFGNVMGEESDPVPCLIEDSQGLARTATGDTVTTTAMVWVMDKTLWPLFTPESVVHLNGRTATVFRVEPAESGTLGLPDQLKVVLT